MPNERVKAKILSQEKIAPSVFLMKVIPEKKVKYLSGQFASVGFEKDGRDIKRPYSIASSPDMDELEFCYVVHEESDFSPLLCKKGVGEEVFVEYPFGSFFFDKKIPDRDIVFVAGGTGIAPLLGMIRYIDLSNTKNQIWLFFGFRTGEHYLYKDELEELEKNHENFHLVTSISREDEGWKGEKGYVQEFFSKMGDGAGKEAYVCGPPRFVKGVIPELEKAGLRKEDIHSEGW